MNGSTSVRGAALLGCLMVVGCAVHTAPLPVPGAGAERPGLPAARPGNRAHASLGTRRVKVRVTEDGRARIQDVALEDYVRTAIISEFAPPSGDLPIVQRMLEVQAVLARTYALSHLGRHKRDGYDLCSTTHCQLYEPSRLRRSRWAAAGAEATRRTTGLVLWFDRTPASAVFHADCGGHTSDPSTVWTSASHPYLRAVADDGPAAAAHKTWRYEVPRETLRRALNLDPRTAPGRRLDSVTVGTRDAAGRAVRVLVRGQRDRAIRGDVLREVLSRAFGARAIRSTWFNVEKVGTTYVFEGRGFGHGVGLCQAGALAHLTAGATPAAVLGRYFPGTRLLYMENAGNARRTF